LGGFSGRCRLTCENGGVPKKNGIWIVGGVCVVGLHAIYHRGVKYSLTSRRTGWTAVTNTSKRPSWEKDIWVFALTKGPGRENIHRDLQHLVDEGGKTFRICECCGASNEEIVVKTNQ
jgi:hypothetical protein